MISNGAKYVGILFFVSALFFVEAKAAWVTMPCSNPSLVPSDGIFNVVRDFGARGNGTNDDTAAINNAIACASAGVPANYGSTVYIPAGTYKITSPITVTNTRGLRVYGAGATTVLRWMGTGYTFPAAFPTNQTKVPAPVWQNYMVPNGIIDVIDRPPLFLKILKSLQRVPWVLEFGWSMRAHRSRETLSTEMATALRRFLFIART